mmetsp:Transcript_59387/g.127588  ORF Transcript_59387/g.127588 Transcript_59387/m.127588 type:complete len:284 (-) Transcript_59387:275-1126(-)
MARAPDGVLMGGAVDLRATLQLALEEAFRLVKLPEGFEEHSKIVQAAQRIGVVAADARLEALERAAVQRLGLDELASRLEQPCKVGDALQGARVLGAQPCVAATHCAAIEPLGLVMLVPGLEEHRKVAHEVQRIRVHGTQRGLIEAECAAVQRLRLLEAAFVCKSAHPPQQLRVGHGLGLLLAPGATATSVAGNKSRQELICILELALGIEQRCKGVRSPERVRVRLHLSVLGLIQAIRRRNEVVHSPQRLRVGRGQLPGRRGRFRWAQALQECLGLVQLAML